MVLLRNGVPSLILVLILLLAPAGRSTAENTVPLLKRTAAFTSPGIEVSLRFNKHEGFSRIVLEATDDQFIRNTVVTVVQNQVKVQFPSPLTLKVQSTPDIATALKERVYTITPNGPFVTKILKLTGPPRLSIDIIAQEKEAAQKPVATETAPSVINPNLRVVLDPGHGGYDLGMIVGDIKEKDITLSVVKDIEVALARKIKATFLTRRSDQYLSLAERALLAVQKYPDVFVSFHLSQSASFVIYTPNPEPLSPEATASETHRLTTNQAKYLEKSRLFAEALGKGIKEEFKADLVFRRLSLPLLNSIGAPAVMIELPGSVIYDKATRARLSEALVKGISLYAGR